MTLLYGFNHGVASGDPHARQRYFVDSGNPRRQSSSVDLTLQVSDSEDFGVLLQSQTVSALAKNDYTAKVDLTGLSPNSQYYYRFVTKDTHSSIGRCKTLPANDVTQASGGYVLC